MKDTLFALPPSATPRDRLVDRIGSDFYALDQQLTTGLQELLERHGVSPPARAAVREYIDGVVKDLCEIEKGVVRLADVPGASEAGYGVKAKLGPAMSALFEEIRQDEAASKREDAHMYDKETLQTLRDGKAKAPQPGTAKEQDRTMER